MQSGKPASRGRVVRIPRRVSRPRSAFRAGQAPRVGTTLGDGVAYRVERNWGMGEKRFVVVAPSGARACSGSPIWHLQKQRSRACDMLAQPRDAMNAPTGGIDDGEHCTPTSRIPLG